MEDIHPLKLFPTENMVRIFSPNRERTWKRIPREKNVEVVRFVPPTPPSSPSQTNDNYLQTRVAISSPASRERRNDYPPLDKVHVRALHDLLKKRDTNKSFGQFFSSLVGSIDPKEVNVRWLKARGITTRDLVIESKIPITDLYEAGILRSFEDLEAIGFSAGDLTENRALFYTNQAVTLFGASAEKMRRGNTTGGFNITTLVYMENKFNVDELSMLQVSLPDLFLDENGVFEATVDGRVLGMISLSPTELRQLGATRELLTQLRVTASMARKVLGWNPVEIQRLFDLPANWHQA